MTVELLSHRCISGMTHSLSVKCQKFVTDEETVHEMRLEIKYMFI